MKKLRAAWKYGWPVGLFMFVVVEVVPAIKEKEFDPVLFGIGLLVWSLGALWCGYVILRIKNRIDRS